PSLRIKTQHIVRGDPVRPLFVMAGLVPAIHENKPVDPRVKPGDDELRMRFIVLEYCFRLIGAAFPLKVPIPRAGAAAEGFGYDWAYNDYRDRVGTDRDEPPSLAAAARGNRPAGAGRADRRRQVRLDVSVASADDPRAGDRSGAHV